MTEYHVGCGITGIFAGTLNKDKTRWTNKRKVTDEALEAVRDYLLGDLLGRKEWTLKDGRIVELRVTIKPKTDKEQSDEK